MNFPKGEGKAWCPPQGGGKAWNSPIIENLNVVSLKGGKIDDDSINGEEN